MKKVIAIIVSMIMVLAMAPLNAFAIGYGEYTNPEDGHVYEVYVGGTLYSSIEQLIDDGSFIKIPGEIDGVAVKFIGDSAFESKNIEEVVLPDSILNIYENAFKNCYNLKKINIPAECIIISEGAFSGCKNLKEITLTNDTYIIEANALATNDNGELVLNYSGTKERWKSWADDGFDTKGNVAAIGGIVHCSDGDLELHDWETVKKTSPTVFKKGTIEKQCTYCNETKTEYTAKLTPKKAKLSKSTATLRVGKSTTVTASGWAKGDGVKSWSSSNSTVAKVTKLSGGKAKIVGKKKGTATITVKLKSGKKTTMKVTVKNKSTTTTPRLTASSTRHQQGDIFTVHLDGAKAKSWDGTSEFIIIDHTSTSCKVYVTHDYTGIGWIECETTDGRIYTLKITVY